MTPVTPVTRSPLCSKLAAFKTHCGVCAGRALRCGSANRLCHFSPVEVVFLLVARGYQIAASIRVTNPAGSHSGSPPQASPG